MEFSRSCLERVEYGEKCESGEVLMKISQAVNSITPSLTRELFNLAQEYDDVIDLTLGDPDIQPDNRSGMCCYP